MLPRRSSILTAALAEQNGAQGNSENERSIIAESSAYAVLSNSKPKGSPVNIELAASLYDQALCEFGVDTPVSQFIDVAQCRAVDLLPKPQSPSQAARVEHYLVELPVVAVNAVLVGADTFVEIELWAKERMDLLVLDINRGANLLLTHLLKLCTLRRMAEFGRSRCPQNADGIGGLDLPFR